MGVLVVAIFVIRVGNHSHCHDKVYRNSLDLSAILSEL